MSEDSDEDMDSDVTVEEEQEDEAGVDAFSDGNDVAAFLMVQMHRMKRMILKLI